MPCTISTVALLSFLEEPRSASAVASRFKGELRFARYVLGTFERLGWVKYTRGRGWTRTLKGDVELFSQFPEGV